MRNISAVDLIHDLVAYDTTSRDSNLALIGFVQDYLDDLGVESRLVHDETGQKANLYATLGPLDKPGIMLSGHTDVVPVDGQDWDSDPFEVLQKNKRLYGRGTSDMKSFLAVALAYAPKFLDRGLNTPIHLAFSYDEEIGCIGVRRLIAVLNEMTIKPKLCIVGEPTDMKVVIAHKGKTSYRCRVSGLEAHSSLAPHGVNAIEFAAELIAHMKSMARRIAKEGPFDPLFDVPHTTIHTGTVKGGTALNIVPKECIFDFEIRYLPDEKPETYFEEIEGFIRNDLEPEMKSISASAGFEIDIRSAMPGLNTDPGEEVVSFVKSLAGQNDHGKVAFGTEAGLFQHRAGIPTVVCGPGSVTQAHKPNEFIELAQVTKCEAFMDRLIEQVCDAA
ncbi:MAG TPA: acetylornithine deacetylase [Rhodospirillaceae bacterium]|nr:acetylornithine deacetylase [Rhodospirillaceae bacterium]HAA90965.1 acetylornithine deacetylase [Rhodospirillaceae bacterium]HAT35570.1 acetylornithine deacetylase [Rhodospirillaceae bacterium]